MTSPERSAGAAWTNVTTVPPGERRLISIICPIFNEEQAIPIFYGRLQRAVRGLRDRYDFELLFLNNCSTDSSLAVLKALRENDPSIQIITLSRNFGYQASVQAGLSYATGDGVVVIDVDCEDPPELLPEFITKWQEGYDLVCGIRGNRAEAWMIKKLRNLFYHLLRGTADMDIVLYMAEFALISATVRDAILDNQNSFPFLRAEIGYAGFHRYEFRYDRQSRVAGETHYNLIRMVSFAVAGLLTSSTFLMRLAVYMFPLFVVANIALLTISHPAAFRILVALDLMYVAAMITVHGMYIARIYKNGIRRPNYIVDPRNTYISSALRGSAKRVPAREFA
jgi:glycosyltransferase involved in cell wall biosynthesis